MQHGVLIILILILFVVLLLSELHISTLLFALGIIGIWAIVGFSKMTGFLVTEPYKVIASYTLSTIPMYVLMAQFIMGSGMVKTTYALIFKLGKNSKGILGALTLIIGGFLGAVSGSGTAAAASLARISGPELRERGYSPELAAAVTACAGSLSAIIPPSIMLVVYSSYSQDSIGKLFMASMVPGILTVVVFIAVTFVFLRTKGEREYSMALDGVEEPALDKKQAIISVFFFILLILIIFGGIYGGIMTPTEAGAVGAFASFIIALIFKAVNWEFIKNALFETGKVTGMCLTIMIGGQIFGKFVTLSGLTKFLQTTMEPLIERPTILLIILGIVYFIIFCLMDGTSPYLITLPIIHPIILAAGVDSMWFGVYITLLCTLGCMTPPVGFCVYAVSAIMTDVPIMKIFKKAVIFAIVGAVVVGGLMIAFPQLTTWLPGMMK